MRVLCINGDFKNARLRPAFQYIKEVPKELNEYNIRDTITIDGRIGYYLMEICGGFNPSGAELSFDSSRFVPLTERDLLEEINEMQELQELCILATL